MEEIWEHAYDISGRDIVNFTDIYGEEGALNNSSNSSGVTYVEYEFIWKPDVIQRVVMLMVIMVMTIVGNTAIIVVLTCSRYRKRSSRVNIFIINLAIGDLTVCVVTMTSELLFVVFGEWVLGPAFCKLIVYGQVVTLASTTFILLAMSYDRYMAICQPLSFTNSSSRARETIVCSWVLAFIFALPQLFIFVQTDEGIYRNGNIKHGCTSSGYTASWQRKLYFTFLTCYILVLPGIMITFFYSSVACVVWQQGKECARVSGQTIRRTMADKSKIPRAKVRTIKMTLCIIISFIICWSPYFIVTLIVIYSEEKVEIPKSVIALAETMALLNSAINPILYSCFNLKMLFYDIFCPWKLKRTPGSMRSGATEMISLSEDAGLNRRSSSLHGGPRYTVLLSPNREVYIAGPRNPSSGRNLLAPPTISDAKRDSFMLNVRRLSKRKKNGGFATTTYSWNSSPAKSSPV